MQFADFTWYSDNYGGKRITEDEFNGLARRASAKVNHYTFGRAEKLTEIPDAVKDATCTIAEMLQAYDNNPVTPGIQSESNDGYSVSYSEKMEEKRESAMYVTVYDYLAPTGLMYRGVGTDD